MDGVAASASGDALTIQRMMDNVYAVQIAGSRQPVRIKVKDPHLPLDRRYALVTAVVQNMLRIHVGSRRVELGEARYLSLGGLHWYVRPSKERSWLLRWAPVFTSAVHPQGDDGVLRVSVSPYSAYTAPPSELKAEDALIHALERLSLGVDKKVPDVLASADLTQEWDSLSAPAFDDPFTRLAAYAFQVHETHYVQPDDFDPDQCSCALLQADGQLLLVKRGDGHDLDASQVTLAVQTYRAFLADELGEQRLRYMEHLFSTDLAALEQSGRALTPEHVYRFNMAIQNSEWADLVQWAQMTQGDMRRFQVEASAEADLDGHLIKSYADAGVPRIWLRRLYASCEGRAERYNQWCEQIGTVGCDPLEWTAQQTQLLQILWKGSECAGNAMYTGRAITQPILSAYTTAGLRSYKPWLDMQELYHTFECLTRCRNHQNGWHAYYELLSHVVCKKHLIREHPVEHYRIGLLLPAPGDRWYRVARCVSNGYGMFCYTLEPLWDNGSMPTIQLYRSTASSGYALQAGSSVQSDINNLNSPGYQGRELTASVDREFFHARTMPLWVGYLLRAREAQHAPVDHDMWYEQLMEATAALRNQHLHSCRHLSLEDIARDNDWLLNELLGRPELIEQMRRSGRDFDYLYRHLRDDCIRSRADRDLHWLAVELKAALEPLEIPHEDRLLREGVATFVTRLQMHVLTDGWRQDFAVKEQTYNRRIGTALSEAYQRAIEARGSREYQQMGEPSARRFAEALKAWTALLEAELIEAGEDPAGKQAGTTALIGHSLAGSIAQASMVQWLVDEWRMPLPGKRFTLYSTGAPRINQRDTVAWNRYLLQHQSLIEHFGVQYHLHHRFEAGDLTTQVGMRHLGSAESREERDRLARIVGYGLDVRIRRKCVDTQDLSMRDRLTVHETQFERAPKYSTILEQRGDYEEVSLDAFQMGLLDQDMYPAGEWEQWSQIHHEWAGFSRYWSAGGWMNWGRETGRALRKLQEMAHVGRRPVNEALDDQGMLIVKVSKTSD